MSLDEGILVIEWTADDFGMDFARRGGGSYGPEYDQSACRAMP